LLASPFTKVEESFNIQAIHDIAEYGIPTLGNGSYIAARYDHVEFPGAVPRTFVGALFVALLSKPFLLWISSPTLAQVAGEDSLGAELDATLHADIWQFEPR
jgi:alpha-1,6-mannosyltransferase